MKYFVIAEKKEIDAFHVIGVSGIAVSSEKEGKKVLQDALLREDIGTVILSEKIYEKNISMIKEHESTGRFPVILKL
ncbi:MAG: V-type ATP synthase subunit F [Sphaerochaeta sp.]